MPSLKMKTKLNSGCQREQSGLHVCQKSNVISKNPDSHVRVSLQMAVLDNCNLNLDNCNLNCQNVSLSNEGSAQEFHCNETVNQQGMLDEKRASTFVDSTTMVKMETTQNCGSTLETIFSPLMESIEVHSELNPTIEENAGCLDFPDYFGFGLDDSFGDGNISFFDNQICNVSDFFISDMVITNLPFDENRVMDDTTEMIPLPDYNKYTEPSMLFDVTDQYMILPFLEDNVSDAKSYDDVMVGPEYTGSYFGMNQMNSSCNVEYDDVNFDANQAEDFDPQMFLRNLPELSEVVSNFCPVISSPKEHLRRKNVTLVLDLDETLVHSTLDQCENSDFTFTVFFNMNEHTVFVKKRPHLHVFLEKVAEMFEIVIFTASQSIYASQLLDVLDPQGKIISRRLYRESCIFSDESYTKDLTVLDVDLAKVAIVDNSPQVFRLQVNNGIPIKSWFDDPTDNALLSLLSFLETLVDADDVRPIIAKKFGNKE